MIKMAIRSQKDPKTQKRDLKFGILRKKKKEANLELRLNQRQNRQHYQKILNNMLNRQDKDLSAESNKNSLQKNVKKLFANYQPKNCSLSEIKPIFPPPLKPCSTSSNNRNRRVMYQGMQKTLLNELVGKINEKEKEKRQKGFRCSRNLTGLNFMSFDNYTPSTNLPMYITQTQSVRRKKAKLWNTRSIQNSEFKKKKSFFGYKKTLGLRLERLSQRAKNAKEIGFGMRETIRTNSKALKKRLQRVNNLDEKIGLAPYRDNRYTTYYFNLTNIVVYHHIRRRHHRHQFYQKQKKIKI